MILTLAAVIGMAVMLLAGAAQAEDWRASEEQYWISRGFTVAAAEGITDQATKESGGNPTVIGDGGSSLGMFQHHAERMDRLLARIENDQALAELMGDDPVAAAHFNELKNARSRAEASQLWQRYFERPKGVVAAAAIKPSPAAPRATQQMKAEVFTKSLDPFAAPDGDADTGSSFLISGR